LGVESSGERENTKKTRGSRNINAFRDGGAANDGRKKMKWPKKNPEEKESTREGRPSMFRGEERRGRRGERRGQLNSSRRRGRVGDKSYVSKHVKGRVYCYQGCEKKKR